MLASEFGLSTHTDAGGADHAAPRAHNASEPKFAKAKSALLSTVAFVGKGGSGKSSICINLAVIARYAGFRVGVVDADPQKSSSEWRRARDNGDIPVRRCDPDRIDEAVASARRSGLQILFIDTPPDCRYALAAARCADLTLIPMRPTLFDLKATHGIIQLLDSAGGGLYGVVINAAPPLRREGDAPMVRETRMALANIGPRLWRRQITHRLAVAYAATSGAGVIETEPDGSAAKEYGELWKAVCETLQLQGTNQ